MDTRAPTSDAHELAPQPTRHQERRPKALVDKSKSRNRVKEPRFTASCGRPGSTLKRRGSRYVAIDFNSMGYRSRSGAAVDLSPLTNVSGPRPTGALPALRGRHVVTSARAKPVGTGCQTVRGLRSVANWAHKAIRRTRGRERIHMRTHSHTQQQACAPNVRTQMQRRARMRSEVHKRVSLS